MPVSFTPQSATNADANKVQALRDIANALNNVYQVLAQISSTLQRMEMRHK